MSILNRHNFFYFKPVNKTNMTHDTIKVFFNNLLHFSVCKLSQHNDTILFDINFYCLQAFKFVQLNLLSYFSH